MPDTNFPCGKCKVNIPKKLRVIKCNSCIRFFHVKCCGVNHNNYKSMVQEKKFGCAMIVKVRTLQIMNLAQKQSNVISAGKSLFSTQKILTVMYVNFLFI